MMYQKKPKKSKSPLAQAASKPKTKPTSQASPISTGTGATTSVPSDPYTKPFMGSFLNTIEQSAGKEAVAKAISHARKGKLDNRL